MHLKNCFLLAAALIASFMGCQNDPTVYQLLENQEYRPSRGRLTAIAAYQPSTGQRPADSLRPESWKAWARLEQQRPDDPSRPQTLLDDAYRSIFFDEFATAALKLEELRSQKGEEANILNDLSVVMLEWALDEDQPLDLLEALRLSSHAVAKQPSCVACQFNVALSLSHLHLRQSASKAWNSFLQLEPDSTWRNEAEAWISRLNANAYKENSEAIRTRLLSPTPLPSEELTSFVQAMPEEVRRFTEEDVLSRWAQAILDRDADSANFWLNRAQSTGRSLAERGSWLLADAVALLEDAPSMALAEGHATFGQAMAAYHAQEFLTAEKLLLQSEQFFTEQRSVYADVAALYRAICIYYRDVDSARPRFESLLARGAPERYPSLVARTLWMLGILDMVQRRTDLALQRFEQMKPLLVTSMGPQRAAIADTLMAETLELRGETERSWRHRIQGLANLVFGTDARRRHSALLEAAQALARRGEAELALIFLDEVVANASDWDQPLGKAEAFSARARAKLLVDDLLGARNDLKLAFAALKDMPEGDPLRERTASLTHLYRGMVESREHPKSGLQLMQEAHDALETGGWREERLEYLEQRAQALLASGNREDGRKILLTSVQEIERLRMQTEDTMSRLEILRHAQSFHEALIRSSLDLGSQETFEQAERARGRELLQHDASTEPVLPRLQAELERHETLVLFTSLPDELWVWVVENDRFDHLRLNTQRSPLEQRTELFLNALRIGDHDTTRRIGQQLYSLLIEPLALAKNLDQRLILIPDLMLSKLPFAALFDSRDGKFLIEQMALVQAPSINLYLQTRRHRLKGTADQALVIADPELNSSTFTSLEPLKRARTEAQMVAELYAQSKLISGSEATPDQVLEDLPQFTIFHFAGHALASGPSLDDSLLLMARGPSGLSELAAGDVRGLQLHQLRVAILAACRSAEGVRKGREAAASLATAFLGAGASSVVATRWDIDDHTSHHLTGKLHRYLSRGEDAASAYRKVVLDLLSSNQIEHTNPSYWAVFVVLGT